MGLRKTAMLLILVALSIGAGMEIGWMWRPLDGKYHAGAQPGENNPGGPRPWIDQLGLRPDQQKDIDSIWNNTRQQMQKLFQQQRDLVQQRDKQVTALLNADQKSAFEKIQADFRAGRENFDKQRESLIADANLRSRALLDPAQQEKWDALSKEIRRRHGPGGGPGPMGPGPMGSGPMGPGGPHPATTPSNGFEMDHHN